MTMKRELTLAFSLLFCAATPRAADWTRKPLSNPYCGKARQVLSVSLGAADAGKLEEKVRNLLDDAKAVTMAQACSAGYATPPDHKQGGALVVINVWVDSSAVNGLKPKLLGLSKKSVWSDRGFYGGVDASVAERWTTLAAELSAHEDLLRCSPHTLDLAKAELARLEPYAMAYLDTKDKSHLQIIVYALK